MTLLGTILRELARLERLADGVPAARVVRVDLAPAAVARVSWEVAGYQAHKEAADEVLEALTWRHPSGAVWYCDAAMTGEAYRFTTSGQAQA